MAEDKEEVKSFKDLGVCEQLVEACDNLGWKNPSKIQADAIPQALEGKDLIGLAETRSGKTGTFAIPILQALLETPQAFFACVLSPTWELAIQIAEQFEALGSGIGVKCAVRIRAEIWSKAAYAYNNYNGWEYFISQRLMSSNSGVLISSFWRNLVEMCSTSSNCRCFEISCSDNAMAGLAMLLSFLFSILRSDRSAQLVTNVQRAVILYSRRTIICKLT